MLDRVAPTTFAAALAQGALAAPLTASALDGVKPRERPRARHALMLSYAGKRRRAAQLGLDGPYWKALHPAAVQRARDLRRGAGFGPLP